MPLCYLVVAVTLAGASPPLAAAAATPNDDYPGSLVLEDQWKQSNYWKEFNGDDDVSYNNPTNKEHGRDSLIRFCPNATNFPGEGYPGTCVYYYDGDAQKNGHRAGPITLYTTDCFCDHNYRKPHDDSDAYYYSVVNRALGTDDPTNISEAISLIKYTVLELLGDGPLPAADSMILWRGDWFREENIAVLQKAKEAGSVVRFRVLASTSLDDKAVPEFGDFKYKIMVPRQTVGPRNIKNLSEHPKEDEILFPPYYPFMVMVPLLVALTCQANASTLEFPGIDCPFPSIPKDTKLHGQPSLRGQARSNHLIH